MFLKNSLGNNVMVIITMSFNINKTSDEFCHNPSFDGEEVWHGAHFPGCPCEQTHIPTIKQLIIISHVICNCELIFIWVNFLCQCGFQKVYFINNKHEVLPTSILIC